jgi:hypothetical protein
VCLLQRGGPLVSLAHSTRASFLRQLGWHDRARRWDGRAMAMAGSDPEAGADALIGLAADALGVGRFAASAAALRRAGDLLTRSVPPRLPVRLAWVSAELAMATGDGPTAVGRAEGHQRRPRWARRGIPSNRTWCLPRRLCSAGGIDRSRMVADAALDAAGGRESSRALGVGMPAG